MTMLNHLLRALLCASLLLSAAACDKPPKPDPAPGPTPNPTPDPDPKPAAPYFRADLPAECVINFDQGVVAWTVETNITDWTVSSSETWCKATPKAEQIWLEVENYDARDENGFEAYDPPRICTVTVQAGTVFNKTIKLVQQTHTIIDFPQRTYSMNYDWILDEPSGMVVLLSADGQTRELVVQSNAYRWIPTTEASWLKVECLNNSTLKLTSTARPETESEARTATVKLYVETDELNYVTFQVQDAPAKVGGPDLNYGDHTDWD